MSKNSKKSYLWKHCFRRKDWMYNRRQGGFPTGKADLIRLVCKTCNHQKLCLPVEG